MRYKDTKDQSAEILRQVLPAMAQHPAAYHPLTYTVWYEYIAGCNPALHAAIDTVVDSGGRLDESDVARLFDTHILAAREQRVQQTCDAFRLLIKDVSQSTQTADARAGEYVDSLAHIGRQLAGGVDHPLLQTTVQELIDNTAQMRGSVSDLRQQLSDSTQRVNELRQALMEAQHQALLDPLTGLVNRRGFDTALKAVLGDGQTQADSQTCLLMIDIDHFKRINDTHGHLVGDKVIRSVAKALKDSVKGKDTVARVGGEEFTVLLPNTPISGACALAEQLRATVERGRIRRTDTQETVATVTVSIGVCAYHRSESTDTFISRADTALYAAKNAGRNRVVVAPEHLRAA
jgi:diguanylate cyclase